LVDQLTYDNDNLHEKTNYLQQQLQEITQKTSEEKVIPTENVNVESIQKELRKTEEEVISLKEVINSNIKIIDSLEQKNLSLESNLQKELDQYEQKFNEFTKLISDREQQLEQQQLEYKKIEDANKQLSDLIVELRMSSEFVPRILTKGHKPKSTSIDRTPIPLFFKMYNKLDDDSKNAIITQLIESLQNGERDLKIYAIKILSIIRDQKCLDALVNLKDDSDWIIRLYLIKSLANFEPSDIESTLKFLKKDEDIDVREAAAALLSKICND
ncbi:MAG: HEAT repeat domain-containing protein, partial [Candidatus Hermodarchaeota archaeon]